MEFEWDENKDLSNKNKHGYDFDYAKLIFEDKNRMKFRDIRNDYGEERWITVGYVLDSVFDRS